MINENLIHSHKNYCKFIEPDNSIYLNTFYQIAISIKVRSQASQSCNLNSIQVSVRTLTLHLTPRNTISDKVKFITF